MSRNSFGRFFCITSFGESHGEALGVVIDGCPAGLDFDRDLLLRSLERRRPGSFGSASEKVVSQRAEPDVPEVLSGVFSEKTLGTPITILVRNKDARSKDYDSICTEPRPGHADDTWLKKFGHTDHRGGGRSSGRETVARVMAGAVAEMLVKEAAPEFSISAYANQIGPVSLSHDLSKDLFLERGEVDSFVARFPSRSQESEVEALLLDARETGKSYGGRVKLRMRGLPAGLGQPVFHKLKADLTSALMSIGATAGVEIGETHQVQTREGSEFHRGETDVYGGIRGGISTGEEIIMQISFKPTSSVLDVAKKGRHDPCIVTRAIPVIESMCLLVVADHLLWQRTDRV